MTHARAGCHVAALVIDADDADGSSMEHSRMPVDLWYLDRYEALTCDDRWARSRRPSVEEGRR